MRHGPRHGSHLVATDGVDVEIGSVDFEIEPIEAKGLREAEHTFAIVRIDAVYGGLVEQGDDCVAKNPLNRSVHIPDSLRYMLEILTA